MKTTIEWWSEIKNNSNLLIDWLKDQYHGEVTAGQRIIDHLVCYTVNDTIEYKLLMHVAEQEKIHAAWIGQLLRARGIEPQSLDKKERYWDQVLPDITNLEYGSAVAAHAEEMRLERIKVIAEDSETPDDIRLVFKSILPQELGHAKIFNFLAKDQKNKAAEQHAKGLEAIGLII